MLGNCVEEAAGPPGTGATVTLAGATEGSVPWYNTFQSGAQVYYAITDGVQVEEGIGTYTIGPPATLSRDTVLWTSALGRNSPVRLSFTTQVWVSSELPAERAVWRNPAGDIDMAGRLVTNMAPGAAAGDAVRLDQIAWRPLGSQTMGGGIGQGTFALPSGYRRFRLEFEEFGPSAAAMAYLRLSNDNGATYRQGATDYAQLLAVAMPSGQSVGGGQAASVQITPTTGYAATGHVEFQAAGSKRIYGSAAGITSDIYRADITGLCNLSGAMNAVQLAWSGSSYAVSGTVRLLGAPV